MKGEPLADLYRRQRRDLARSVAPIAGADEADDLVHDAFLAFLATSQDADRPSAWLWRVARNRALNQVRRLPALPLDEADHADDAHPGSGSEREATRATVARVLAGLPERFRHALELRFFEGCSYDEIADALGCRVAQAHVVVHRATRRFGRELVRQLAASHGAEPCVDFLEASAGIAAGDANDHGATPCIRCRPAFDELAALRSIPALLPAVPLPVSAIRRIVARVAQYGARVGEPAAQLAHALAAFGVVTASVYGASAPRAVTPASAAVPAVAASAPARAVVSAEAPALVSRAPAAPARAPAAPVRTSDSVGVGGVSVTSSDSATQAEAQRGSAGWSGVVVCQPLEPCPPPPP